MILTRCKQEISPNQEVKSLQTEIIQIIDKKESSADLNVVQIPQVSAAD